MNGSSSLTGSATGATLGLISRSLAILTVNSSSATLQSEPAQQILKELGFHADDLETFLLLEHGRVFTKSTAALRILRHLSGLWPLLYVGIAIPRPLRDALYDYIARHRYQWMGKSETCCIPTTAERERFV